MKIDINNINGDVLYSCSEIGEGSKRYFKMQEYDYITLAFSLKNPIYFKLGDYVDNELGLFELVTLYSPTYNNETGGYDYNLRLDAHYWKWKNKVFKYTPELFGQEASWSLTASLSVHLNVFLKNLKAWGFKFRDADYTYEIQSGYGETSKALTYSNTNLIDALTMMAEAWGCEWWITDNVIHFGRAEYGTETTFEQGVNVESMSRSESETEYATRIIAFGGESNIPAKYRKDLIFTNDGNGSEVKDDFRKLSYEYFAPESIISPEKKTLTANAEDDDIGDKTRPLFFSFRLPLGETLELGKSYEIDLTSVVLKADITGGEFTGTQKVDIVLATSASLFNTVASLEFEAIGATFTKNLTTISFKVEETYNGEMPNNLYVSVNTSENVTDVNGRISGNASCKGTFTLVNSARSANTSITVLTGDNKGQTYQGVFNPDFFVGDEANVIKLTDGTLGKGEQYQVNNLVRSLVPDNYFTAPKTEATIDGVVSRRLMLPEDTPYIDAVEGLDVAQIVEKIITVDDIFPKRIGTISEVNTVDRDIQDGGEVTGTFKAYQYKDSGIVFDKKYIIKDNTLKITFQSGLLNGLTFEVQFEPNDADKQTWEIVRNENYGRPLPDNIAYPQVGDKYILTGFDVEFVSDFYVPEAEQELKEYAIKAAEESYNRSFTYTVTMQPDYMFNGGEIRRFDLGDKIKIINKAYFEGSRSGRILGYEYPLDKPYDSPIYTVGDSPAYSRFGALEKKVETLQYGGKTYTGTGTSTGGGTSVYVIGSNDKTAWTDRNVLSSLRLKKEFLSKTSVDYTNYLLKFLAGAEFGKFVSGLLGTGGAVTIDEDGNSHAEFDYLTIRKIAIFIELIIQEAKSVGGMIIVSPSGMTISSVEETNTAYRCYFEQTDGNRTLQNQFTVGTQARRQTFNLTGQAYYWRLVTEVGKDYVDLSKTDCDTGSTIPQAGDELVGLGHRTDKTRQAAIIISSFGDDSPYIKYYQGIDSFSLVGKEVKMDYYDKTDGRFKSISYGDIYVGARDKSTYVQYDQEEGVAIKGTVEILPGSTGSGNFLDLPDEISKSVKIGGENLLLNTGFLGDYEVLKLNNSTKLESGTEMYNTTLDKWNGTATLQQDSDSLSGVSATISSPLSQMVVLIQGENYVIRYKAKGTLIKIKCGGNTITQDLTSEYKIYYHVFTNNNGNTFEISGNCTVCEIKLERGTIPTDWCPSVMDASSIKDKFKDLWYIQDAMKGSSNIFGGLILSSMIQLGKYTDGIMEKVNAGISGIYNDDTDVAMWSGGTFEQAIATVQKLMSGEIPTDEEWKSLAKFVATHGGDIFIRGYIYALGGVFRGRVETSINGNRIVIDPSTSSLKMYNSDGKVCLNMSFSESEERIFAGINVIEYEGDTPSFSASLSGRILTFSNSIEGYSGLFAPDRISFQAGREEILNIYSSKDYNDGSHYLNIFAPKWNTNSQGLPGNVYVDENGFLKVTK